MQTTLTIVLPVFGVILCGYLIGRTRLFTAEGVRGLTNFVFYVAMPCLLFRAMARLEQPEGVDVSVIFAYFGACLIMFAVAMAIGRLAFRHTPEQQTMLGMSASFSNTVLLGLPLTFTAFGEKGVLPLMLIVGVHPILLIALPTILIEIYRGGGGRSWTTLSSTLAALLRNPIIVAVALGLAYGQTGWAIPAIPDKFIDFIGRAGPPAALFAVGASLADYRIGGDLREVSLALLLKLVCLPTLVWVLATHVFAVEPLWAAVATVNAAMPVGVNVFVLARAYDLYVARAATVVLLSTAISWVTVAILLAVLVPGVGG